jgi:hypothetical protein
MPDKEYPNTFKEWLQETLDADQIKNLANYGADAGWPGLTYYKDTCALYEEYEAEIWECLSDDASGQGYKNILELIATFGGSDCVSCKDTFENLLVWYMAERTARELSGE